MRERKRWEVRIGFSEKDIKRMMCYCVEARSFAFSYHLLLILRVQLHCFVR